MTTMEIGKELVGLVQAGQESGRQSLDSTPRVSRASNPSPCRAWNRRSGDREYQRQESMVGG